MPDHPKSPPARAIAWADLPREQVTAHLARRFIYGEHIMVAQIELAKGCVVPVHAHENEQFTLVLSGSMRFLVGEAREAVVVQAGETIHLPPNLPHGAEALEDTVELDVFSPPRQDWLDGTDTYFHES